MIIELKSHPVFARRSSEIANEAISELEANLIKGLRANATLIERALDVHRAEPSDASVKRVINARVGLEQLLHNLEQEEPDFAAFSDSFVEQYANIKAELVTLRDELEIAAATYRHVQITFNVTPQPLERPWASRILPVAILVCIGSIIIGALL